jgi:predicted metal-dependent hydrolase
VLAPPDVADYVVVHELCHLRVPNHSRVFWTLLQQHRPDWRTRRAWLREHGPELLAFRPSERLAGWRGAGG